MSMSMLSSKFKPRRRERNIALLWRRLWHRRSNRRGPKVRSTLVPAILLIALLVGSIRWRVLILVLRGMIIVVAHVVQRTEWG